MAKKKILLTGSLGFIFSNFIRKVSYEKNDLYTFALVDKAATSLNLNNIYLSRGLATNHIADICDEKIMNRIFELEKPDIVINGAAESSVDKSNNSPLDFVYSNLVGTQVLLNCSKKWGVKKFIQISTDECLGSLGPNDPAWTEESPIDPKNSYSSTKAGAELLVKAFCENNGIAWNITRAGNIYGPRQDYSKLIPRTIKCILEDQNIPIYGDGSNVRDWTFVNSKIDAILKILEFGKDNEIYNISDNNQLSNLELVNKICNIMGKGHNLISFIKDPRPVHDFRYELNCDKLKAIGWKPSEKFSTAFPSVIHWFMNNKWMLK